MFNPIFIIPLLAAVAVGADSIPQLLQRQNIERLPCSSTGEKECGVGCIPLTYTCCPSRVGGCPVGSYCYLGTNGQWGCCSEDGPRCRGAAGGVITSYGTVTSTSTSTSTQTTLIPGEIFTQTGATTATAESTQTQPAESPVLSSVSSLTPALAPIPTPILTPILSSSSMGLLSFSPTLTSLLPSVSDSSTATSNVALDGSPTTTLLVEFTGAADSRVQDASMRVLAVVFPFFFL